MPTFFKRGAAIKYHAPTPTIIRPTSCKKVLIEVERPEAIIKFAFFDFALALRTGTTLVVPDWLLNTLLAVTASSVHSCRQASKSPVPKHPPNQVLHAPVALFGALKFLLRIAILFFVINLQFKYYYLAFFNLLLANN